MWEPERMQVVGSILERVSPHIVEGVRIRRGMEGDPCNIYRGPSESPSGTVTHVDHKEDGVVQFDVKMDNTGDIVRMDNVNIHPSNLWEIHPDFIPEFRDRLLSLSGDNQESSPEPPSTSALEEYRGATERKFEDVKNDIQRITDNEQEFRSTTASTLRYIAADIVRLSRGEPLEFASKYTDRYDEVVSGDEYRGGRTSPTRKSSSVNSRHDFVENIKYEVDFKEASDITSNDE